MADEQEADRFNPPVDFVKTPCRNVCHTSGLMIMQINDKTTTTVWPRYDKTSLLTEIKKKKNYSKQHSYLCVNGISATFSAVNKTRAAFSYDER